MAEHPRSTSNALFLGLDCGTQSMKAVVIDSRLEVVAEISVHYDTDLPQFKTTGGVIRHSDGLTVTAPTLLWVAALDLVFERLKGSGVQVENICSISGSGQQHGSVYWRIGTRDYLRNLNPSHRLEPQLVNAFSLEQSPIWMDSSTSAECTLLEQALNGAAAVTELTGSRAYERFTGPQIAKIFRKFRAAYDATERISLVSSFLASLLIGDYAPIDPADGSGMNLMSLWDKTWISTALSTVAPAGDNGAGLAEKLGTIAPASHTCVGRVAPYYVQRYGMSPDCVVIAFSGDNPCSLAGLQLREGDVAISLGTSDTVFGTTRKPTPSPAEGHIFADPTDPASYMALICFKNGSLAREKVAGGPLEDSLEQTKVGNGGLMGFYYFDPEITPRVAAGQWRFDASDNLIDGHFTEPAAEVRACIESQCISMRRHAEMLGIVVSPNGRILATGGASKSRALLQVLADVFGAPVMTRQRPNSAALGAAYRAKHGWICQQKGAFVSFHEAVGTSGDGLMVAAEPRAEAHAVYETMLVRHARLEGRLASQAVLSPAQD